MSALVEYVLRCTERGECQCGRCVDKGDQPDPVGHTVDLEFLKVSMVPLTFPTAEELRGLVKAHQGEFNQMDPYDGQEHGYMEIGGWIGDQGLALQFMALSELLGIGDVLTPTKILGPKIPVELRQQAAAAGYVTLKARST